MRFSILTAVLAVFIAMPLASPVKAGDGMTAQGTEHMEVVQRVEDYLNAIGTLQARFLQISHDGHYAEGKVSIARPGRMRLDYDPPTQIEIVTQGRFLVYHDKRLEQVTHIPLSAKPAGILLAEKIDLTSGETVAVTNVVRQGGVIELSMVQADDPDAGTLTVVFTERPFSLRQWRVVDPQGRETTVTLQDMRTDVALDSSLFRFVDPRRFQNN